MEQRITNRPSAMSGPSRLIAKLRNASVQMDRCCQETGLKHVITVW